MESHTVTFPQAYTAALCIASSCLSIVGAVTLFCCYYRLRKGSKNAISRTLVMCIAFSDFFTAAGYLVMSSYYVQSGLFGQTQNLTDVFANHSTLAVVCKGQSFVTTTSSMWSFWWTAILAIHLYLGFVWHKWEWGNRLFPCYCTFAWLIPPVLTIPALATGWLGLSCGSTSATWCFVGVRDPSEGCYSTTYSILEAVEGKLWEVGAFLLILGLYLHIWCRLIKSRRKRSDTERSPLKGVKPSRVQDWTVLLIPVVYLLIRMWGTARYFLSLSPNAAEMRLSPTLEVMQAIFDPSQGWTNALIFLLLSNESLKMFQTLKAKARPCCHSLQSYLQSHAARDGYESDRVSYRVVECNGDSIDHDNS